MPDEDPNEDRLRSFDVMERDLLYLLTTPQDGQPLWSIDDLNREMDRRDVTDLVRGLQRAGLVHQTTDGYVFATRAAVRMVQMVGQAI